MYFLLVHLKHAAIDRIEEELRSKRENERELAGRLIAMDAKEQQLAITVHRDVKKLLNVLQVKNVQIHFISK